MKKDRPPKTRRYFVYIVRCSDGTYYTGYTNDLEKRVRRHNSGRGAKYLRGRLPAALVYSRAFSDRGDALRREWKIKQLSRKDKEALVRGYRKKTCAT
jgi:putative endonuclease